ncbi:hypothetical protein PRIPAC_96261, partial [Pristionchus pacificus]
VFASHPCSLQRGTTRNRSVSIRTEKNGIGWIGVCLAPMQFATWNNQKPECLHPHGKEWDWMDRLLRNVLEGVIADPTGGSLHFCNPTEKMPDWTRTMQKGVKIGKYQYYNEEKAPSIFNSEEKFVKQNYDYFLVLDFEKLASRIRK